MCILPGILGLLFPQTFCSSASHRARRVSYQSQSSSRTSNNKSNSDNLHFTSSSEPRELELFSPPTSSSTRKRSRASNLSIPTHSRKTSFLEATAENKDLSPTTQLVDLGGELDYQGQVLSRIVRDIHFQHEVGNLDNFRHYLADIRIVHTSGVSYRVN